MTHIRSYASWVTIAALTCATVAVCFLTWYEGGVSSVSGVPPTDYDCRTDIARILSAEEAFYVGESFFEGGAIYDISCARAAYYRAAELDPRAHRLVWHQLGRLDFLEGNFSGAIVKFEKQQEYFGDEVPNVHYMLGLTYGYRAAREGIVADWARAESHFEQFIVFDDQTPWPRVDLAWVLFAQGKYEAMKPVLEPSLALHPNNPWVLNMYGLALLNTGERERAHQFFSDALRLAEALTVADWGMSYPGNDPASWPKGLEEMKEAIRKNVNISSS